MLEKTSIADGLGTPRISRQLHLEKSHVAGAVRLFNEGSTLPFIARYRKEQTGTDRKIIEKTQ